MHTYGYYVSTLNEIFENKYNKAKNKPTNTILLKQIQNSIETS